MKVKWNKKVKICCGALIVALIGLAIVKFKSTEGETESFKPVFEEEQTKEKAESGMVQGIKIPGYETISIAADQTLVSINLENPQDNPCYFQISIYLKDSGELLYQSNLLKPGQHLYEIELERSLSAGSYPITIQYDTFSMDEEYGSMNGATTTCTLVVG